MKSERAKRATLLFLIVKYLKYAKKKNDSKSKFAKRPLYFMKLVAWSFSSFGRYQNGVEMVKSIAYEWRY